jgi:hypothetical protein
MFSFQQYDPTKYKGIHIFNSRIINKIKNKTITVPYKKSKLVIQAYNNNGKEVILTQLLTIQRAS